MNFITKHWWKAGSVILLTYVLIVGLLMPIAPSVISVSPEKAELGGVYSVTIHTLHSHFSNHAENLKAYIISNDKAIASDSISIINNTTLHATFKIAPWLLPSNSTHTLADLLVNTDYDGNMVLRSAFSINKNTTDTTTLVNASWPAPISGTLTVGHQTPQYRSFPMREILHQSIRNLFFHVPMWFAMITILFVSCFYSIRYLMYARIDDDIYAQATALTGIVFGIAGLLTGMQWARSTWGAWWTDDAKLNGAAITMLMYLAYSVLRGSIEDPVRRARISAVYNIFAYAMLIPLLFILPRIVDSLHPGNGGNPGFKTYDLDNNMRLVFYPAAAGWVLLSVWIAQLTYRIQKLNAST